MTTAVRRPVEEYLDLPYSVSVAREERGWTARVDELPGCSARGAKPEAAVAAVRDAMRAWLQQALEEGREIPEPRSAAYSGRLLLRMPRSLHASLARAADGEGVSLNQFIVGALGSVLARPGERSGAASSPESGEAPPRTRRDRLIAAALIANLVLVAVAIAVALALLVVAWQH